MDEHQKEMVLISIAVPAETADRLERIRTRLGVNHSKLFSNIIGAFIEANDNTQSVLY